MLKNLINRVQNVTETKPDQVPEQQSKPDPDIIKLIKNYPRESNPEKLFQTLFLRIKKIIDHNDYYEFKKRFSGTMRELSRRHGLQSSLNLIKRIEVAMGLRKPCLAIYDHCLHFIGGGQKYGMTMAFALQHFFDVTIVADKPVTHENIRDWYDLDLSHCSIRIIPIPFYEKLGTTHLDPVYVTKKIKNPFHLISLESAKYDFFINNSMLEMVYPLANVSVMMVHFPERRPSYYFYSHAYTAIMYNSKYTASWIEKKWKFSPHKHIYPPVDMMVYDGSSSKKNIILSVARFEEGGTKKQLEMIKSFIRLTRTFPETASQWKLILVGGSNPGNPYLSAVKDLIKQSAGDQIELKVNISAEALKSLYRDAKIFWHLCGLGQNDPAKVEHFGMTICEAMQNSIVPVVFDGGGQREIIEHRVNGFRVNSTFQLIQYTHELMEDPDKLNEMGKAAREKSKQYDKARFIIEVKEFFNELYRNHLGQTEA